jgi:uncharacterized UPF0160 family protein
MKQVAKVFSKIPEKLDSKTKIIGTHSGQFHADECLACALLSMTKEFENSIIVRSREPEILAQCHIQVDVGGKYEPLKYLFDHHQKGFEETFPNYKTKLSSAGLIYKFFFFLNFKI